MADQPEFRRYLVNIDSISTHQLFTDCLVIGAGIAGLRAAIEAAKHRNVIIICKDTLENSNTWKAQGGIASVLDKADTFESHIADTLNTGCGICDEGIVDLVVRQGPELIEQLLQWGAEFDLIDGHIATTLEGGHSHTRVAHAHGDETGRILAEALIKEVKQNSNIKILENFYTIDLLTNDDNECVGIIGHDIQNPRKADQIIWAANTILATGGAGRLYRETTNPEGATRALITETLRGEGAVLLDNKGQRFMTDFHEAAELAPRDIVSRAILAQMRKTESTHVYLDVRHFDKAHFTKRFPFISELCESFD
ncbi:MAG: L-aspartate oxidase, partial [Planctomycetota bacterium]